MDKALRLNERRIHPDSPLLRGRPILRTPRRRAALDEELAVWRHWYSEDLRLRTPVRRNMAIVEAFAVVPRERFLGPGPWGVMPDRPGLHLDEPVMTPDDDPRWLYHDVLVTIDSARELNNGLPSFWAHNFDHLDWRPGQRVLQVGAGTGYYSAVLAEIVGAAGRVIAVERDDELAARARANAAPWRQLEVVAGDGRAHDPGEVDAIIVFAGSTHPAPIWLDRLAEGGRLIMPLTTEERWGFVLQVVRRGSNFDAASIGGVGIFPCVGGRDAEAARRLEHALRELRRGPQPTEVPIQTLHRGEPGLAATVWYCAPGFWLERKSSAKSCDQPG